MLYIKLQTSPKNTQSKRQPGSVFKPFIYLSAIENGAKPCTQLINQPLVFFIDDTTRWNPQNHDGSTGLLTSLRDGLRKSLNLISVRIVQELISPKDVQKTAKKFEFSTPIRAVDANALGVLRSSHRASKTLLGGPFNSSLLLSISFTLFRTL